jgi:hypothetical protein
MKLATKGNIIKNDWLFSLSRGVREARGVWLLRHLPQQPHTPACGHPSREGKQPAFCHPER